MKKYLLKRKFNTIFEFYKSTIAINFAVSILGFLFGGFNGFILMIMSFGFILSVLFKEIYRKNDYLFYFNNGISKIQLLGFSFFMNTFSSGLLLVIINFIFK